MRNIGVLLTLFFIGLLPAPAMAMGVEFAAGLWLQAPSGDVSYKFQGVGDTLNLKDDMGLGNEFRFTGRLKVDTPLFLPNIYVMATPMTFDGNGSKSVDFHFGDIDINANVPFTSQVRLTHYDLALYYSIPLLKTATFHKLNIDLGINVRLVDLEASLTQNGLTQSESLWLPLPMLFAAVQVTPIKPLAIEGEFRGITIGGNTYWSLVGRVKYKFIGPMFAAGGYRYDHIDVDESDLVIKADFSGPFIEVGLQF